MEGNACKDMFSFNDISQIKRMLLDPSITLSNVQESVLSQDFEPSDINGLSCAFCIIVLLLLDISTFRY